jgi:UDP-glucuronate 4-epimerase
MLLNSKDDANLVAQNRIYNIGNHQPVKLGYFIKTLEDIISKKALIKYLPMQQGDVLKTYADLSLISSDTGFAPTTKIEQGLKSFVDWYIQYSK